ncbi:hypothetical protein [Kibdelosporangium phytohabitans]|uniref:Uncharacterized protein n=1 Tax=Kibdelosporangium phytohabitans TaxID=860235 RepID=A0A0N9HTA5_9PSEU|nr:hypothetical protein [Kibdelosporangium phytohabitans]ALG10485.1 hypothetical protein AOZ06_29545 [Kibdelosporangium phytohabitans]MBE1461574.1 hypothetical protein [Kibdelosporangium phytohabitans]
MRTTRVSDTGDATAEAGGFANSGVVYGDVEVHATAPVRSAYLEQVRAIAPADLSGRQGELAVLAEFCRGEGAGAYLWWRAEAWAGKSALLSWFVLDPPPGVRVVSFFVTARFAGQSDWIACTDVVMEQLAELLRQPMPAYLTQATRGPHFRRMLNEAALRCQENGERLVLVVDGLDEDRGLDSYSIAGLLPVVPANGMRVVVASRLNPPLPGDVPPDHPLHAEDVVRILTPSEWAQVARNDMERDLKRLLGGSRLEHDLLGLITSAGGGLTGADLSELTGEPAWRVEEHLHTVTGRSFVTRVSTWQPDTAPIAYVLGHEEIQRSSKKYLEVSRLAEYRQVLHDWADRHRTRGWPSGTPEYLLRGYFRLLRETGDVRRLVACATDRARHDRMMDITGGDTAALNEINSAHDALLALGSDDLVSMARLAVHRDEIEQRNANFPVDLPAVLVMLGHHVRAESTALSIADSDRQARALLRMMEPLGVARAVDLIDAVDDPRTQLRLLHHVIRHLAAEPGPLIGRAESLILAAGSAVEQVPSLVDLADAAASAGETTIARDLAGRCLTYQPSQADRARLLAHAGDWDDATRALERTSGSEAETTVFTAVVATAARQGDPRRAEALIESMPHMDVWGDGRNALAEVLIEQGDLDRASTVIRSIRTLASRCGSLIALARAWHRVGEDGKALTAAHEALAGVRGIAPAQQAAELVEIASLYVQLGADDHARAVVAEARALEPVTYEGDQETTALVSVAAGLVLIGDAQEAERFCRSRRDVGERITMLTAVARELLVAGEEAKATVLAAEVEATARAVTDPWLSTMRLAVLSWWATSAGDRDSGRALAVRAAEQAPLVTARRMAVIDEVIGCLARAGDTHQAELFARSQTPVPVATLADALVWGGEVDRGIALTREIEDDHDRARALAEIASTLPYVGEFDRARDVARSVENPFYRARALARTVSVLADLGQADRAWALIDEAEAAIRVMGHKLGSVGHLVLLATTAVSLGDTDRALSFVDVAAEIAPAIASGDRRTTAWMWIIEAVAAAGDVDRVHQMMSGHRDDQRSNDGPLLEFLACSLAMTEPDRAENVALANPHSGHRTAALTKVAVTFARGGDLDRAERLVRSIGDRQGRSSALTELAKVAPAPQARRLLALALRIGRWDKTVPVLARSAPEVVLALAEDVLRLAAIPGT